MKFIQNRTDFVESTIEINGTEHGFVCIRKNAFLAATAHLRFGLSNLHVLVERPFLGRLRTRMPRNNRALAFREFTFGVVRERLVQKLSRQHVENGIAEELQTFVIAHVGHVLAYDKRTMDESVSQQFRIAEPIPKLSLKPVTGLLAKPEF